jgi:hypothetical protein
MPLCIGHKKLRLYVINTRIRMTGNRHLFRSIMFQNFECHHAFSSFLVEKRLCIIRFFMFRSESKNLDSCPNFSTFSNTRRDFNGHQAPSPFNNEKVYSMFNNMRKIYGLVKEISTTNNWTKSPSNR